MDAKKVHTPYASGFGAVAPKGEGGKIVYDTGAQQHRRRKGEKRPVGDDWMEIPVPKNASRARVHKMVDEWLDDRARGFKGAILGLPPIRRRRAS